MVKPAIFWSNMYVDRESESKQYQQQLYKQKYL